VDLLDLAATPRRTCPERWSDGQLALFGSPYHLTVWWGGNAVGKSAGLAELARRAVCGRLHWQRPGPQTVVLAGNTWAQLGSTLEYLWAGVPAEWFRAGVRYESGGVKGQRLAVYDVIGGPGAGGELRLGTFRARNLAGPRADVVITDEPLPADVHGELFSRLLGRNGRMYQSFTPTLGTSEDLDYLWELVDDESLPWAGQIQTELTLASCTPRGGLVEVPWITQAEIDRQIAGISRVEVDMRLGRSRKPKQGIGYFAAWNPELVISDEIPPAGLPVAVGIDHGSRPGAQRAVLVAVGGRSLLARCWVLDEYRGDGRTESEDDARGILEMLARQRLSLAQVDVWIGDRAHGGDWRGGRKSNERLKAAIAREIGLDIERPGWSERLPKALRKMWTPKKRDRSHWEGFELLHRMVVGSDPRMRINPVCKYLIADITEWQGSTPGSAQGRPRRLAIRDRGATLPACPLTVPCERGTLQP